MRRYIQQESRVGLPLDARNGLYGAEEMLALALV